MTCLDSAAIKAVCVYFGAWGRRLRDAEAAGHGTVVLDIDETTVLRHVQVGTIRVVAVEKGARRVANHDDDPNCYLKEEMD